MLAELDNLSKNSLLSSSRCDVMEHTAVNQPTPESLRGLTLIYLFMNHPAQEPIYSTTTRMYRNYDVRTYADYLLEFRSCRVGAAELLNAWWAVMAATKRP